MKIYFTVPQPVEKKLCEEIRQSIISEIGMDTTINLFRWALDNQTGTIDCGLDLTDYTHRIRFVELVEHVLTNFDALCFMEPPILKYEEDGRESGFINGIWFDNGMMYVPKLNMKHQRYRL